MAANCLIKTMAILKIKPPVTAGGILFCSRKRILLVRNIPKKSTRMLNTKPSMGICEATSRRCNARIDAGVTPST